MIPTDNNPLTYVFTTAKLDATGHRWLAELSNYNFSLTYRSGKKNADADGLSRLHETAATTSVFPDALKAICNTVVVQRDTELMVDSLAPPDIVSDIEKDDLDNVPADMISTTALTSQDWQQAQAADDNINFIVALFWQESSQHLNRLKNTSLMLATYLIGTNIP